jgi:hypothetical protein
MLLGYGNAVSYLLAVKHSERYLRAVSGRRLLRKVRDISWQDERLSAITWCREQAGRSAKCSKLEQAADTALGHKKRNILEYLQIIELVEDCE